MERVVLVSVLTYLEFWMATAVGLGTVLAVVSAVILAWMWIIGKGHK